MAPKHTQPEQAPQNHFEFANLLMQGIVRAYELGAAEEAAKEHWQHEASHDSLTGLLNKPAFIDKANQRLAEAKPGQVYALVFIDLDNFKAINDLHPGGYDEGDNLLKTVGNVLLEETRQDEESPDLVTHGSREDSDSARLGGDEFAILIELTGRDDRSAAMSAEQRSDAFCERLSGDLNAVFRDRADLNKYNFGASVTAVLRQPGERAEQLLTRGGRAIKAVKETHHAQNGSYRTHQVN